MAGFHRDQKPVDGIHTVHAFEFANETDRLAFANELNGLTGPLPTDIGKVVRQTDNDTFYLIGNDSPLTYVPIGDGADHGQLTGLSDDDHTQYILVAGTRAFTGDQSLGGNRVTSLGTPVASDDAATRGFVESQIQGLDPKGSVDAATTAALPANSRVGDVLTASANGAFPAIDTVAAVLNNTYLVKDEVAGVNNGLYELTDVGSAGTPWELTRTANFAGGATVAGAFVVIERGTPPPTGNEDSTFLCTNDSGSDVVNTDALAFVSFHLLLTSSAPADVTKAAAVVGVATAAARADHKHDISTAAAGTIAIGDAAAEGTATSLARSDHVHVLPVPAAPADVTKAAAAAGVATTTARADHKHDVSTATPGTIAIGDVAAEGVASSLTRSDHTHALPTPAAPADVTKAAAAAGVATTTARADHKHDVSTAAPATATGTTNTEGTATSLARSDHVHRVELEVLEEGVSAGDRPRLNFIGAAVTAADDVPNDRVNVTITAAALTSASPTQIDVGDAAVVGVATDAARADHQHALPVPAAPADVSKSAAGAGSAATVARSDHKHDVATAIPVDASGTTNAEGSSTSLSRADHAHRTELEFFEEGVSVSSRPRLNFIGTAVTAADDVPNDRVNVTVSAAALTAVTPTQIDAGDAAAVGTGTAAAREDHQHAVNTALAATIAAVDAGAASAGVSATIPRGDHKHSVTTAVPVTVTKSTNAAGTATSLSRSDHKHDVSTAAPAATGVATASGEGTATTLARSDHTHQANTAPADVTKAAAAIGTSGEPARADHKHDVTTAAPSVGVGGGNTEGSATTLARSDHDHTLRTTTGPTNLTIGAVADGEVLTRSGATIVGSSGGGGAQLFRHDVNDAIFPPTDPAQAESRNAHPIASFDDTTAEALIFNGLMSNDYAEGDFNVDIDWVAASATTGGVTWGVSVERLAPGGQDIDSDGFAAQQTGTSTTNATSGVITRTTITLTQAQADLIEAGDRYRIEIERVVGDGGDTMIGDAQIVGVTGRQ